ncbi:MAG TPA: VWA domain-containing protein [Blastocatellia bacterium]|nr:VWA domain-containing protein [Blastocatellia bacterium]
MKQCFARSLLAVVLAVTLSPISNAVPQQENKNTPQETQSQAAQTPLNEAAKAKATAATSGPDDKTTLTRPEPVKPGRVPDDKIVLSTGIVSLTVTVTDPYGRFVTGLKKEHFDVFDDKVKQEIAHFTDDDSPVSLGIVYDVSGSMSARIGRSIRALTRFVETSHDDDDIFLIGFNDRAKLVQDFTTSAEQTLSKLMFVQPKGQTALYDAAYLAVEKIQQGRHTKKALLVISDGQDNNSRYTYKELRNRVKEADVQIYAIGITDFNDSLSGFGRANLEEITRMTGGRAFFPNAYNEPELVEICTRIALELRHQYSIGFYPSDLAADAKWHKVQVKVNPPKGLGRLSLSYRDGYQSFKK